MRPALERRFLEFLAALPGAESLDVLLGGTEYAGERRADYLLFGRRVIVEVKSLVVDTSPKVETEMDRHRERDDFPLMYGEVELQKVLKHLPDGQKISGRIFYRATRSVEDATRSAEEQIANTARVLGLHDPVGVLVVLNEDVAILTPEVVAARVAMLMHRNDETGGPKSSIAFAWLIFESHMVTNGPAEKTLPMVALEGPISQNFPWFQDIFKYLQIAWAGFNGHPLFEFANQTLADLPVASSTTPPPDEKTTRQQYWERRYRMRPHLRHLSDAAVLDSGAEVVKALLPHFLIGGPKLPPDQFEPLIVAWSDFLCEARYRGLDLRNMPKP